MLVAAVSDARPLHILGAELVDLEKVLAGHGQGRRPHALAIAGDICSRDSRAHRGVVSALHDGGVEVVVWGDNWSSPPEHRVDPVVHRLSVAARAFKAQALAAALLPAEAVDRVEVFRSGVSQFPPVGADLNPVG
ncbi:hypothetical protein [Nocardia arizonensis]|uniref:hypothetical protein n=1 Tax=Nocardia arizonensis TaxID=1141647 RepID=UPI001EF49A1D|nr:hypothetical protein [Nocardia arizonensis]